MIISVFEPPPEKRTGGLDPAIRALEAFLLKNGISVRTNPPPLEIGHSVVPEVVHFHGVWEPGYLRISAHCRRMRVPYVVSPHGMLQPWERRYKWWKKWPWFHLFERHHLAGAARLLATSDDESRNLQRWFPAGQCRVLPLGLTGDRRPDYAAARRALGWADGENVILFLSRIHPKKGLDLLLHALATLPHPAPIRLVIVGDGDDGYARELKAFVRNREAQMPRVEWIGGVWNESKWAYLQGADLLCLPSHSENFGLVILEALQVGTRVLTTTRMPWKDMPGWGGGFVVEPDVNAIRRALLEFLANPGWSSSQREGLSGEAYRRFSWEAVGPPYRTLYEEIIRDCAS